MTDAPHAAGWHPDPWFSSQQRWWDGARWTADTFPDGPVGKAGRQAPARRDDAWLRASPPTAYATSLPPAPDWEREAAALTSDTGVLLQSPEPASASARRRIPSAVVNVTALVVGIAIGFVAVDAAVGGGGKTAAAPDPATTTPSPTPAPPAAVLAVLQRLVVRQQDVPADHSVRLLPSGTDARHQPTLDLCNGSYPSEALRVARLQVADVAADGSMAVSTEAVEYASVPATAQAFRELTQVAAACPSGPVVSPVGEPTVTTTLTSGADAGWPTVTGVSRLAFRVTTDSGSGPTTSIAVYLRRGTLLEGVYLPTATPSQLSVEGHTSAAAVVADFEQRLASLPAAAVGG